MSIRRVLRTRVSASYARAQATAPSPFSPAVLTAEYKRFCKEQLIPATLGVSAESFTQHAARTLSVSEEAVAEAVRSMPTTFVFAGTRIVLNSTQSQSEVAAQFEDALSEVASQLPADGVSPSGLYAILAQQVPAFSPAAVGAVSLIEALEKFPSIFTLDPQAKGRFLVKSTTRTGAQRKRKFFLHEGKSQSALEQDVCAAVSAAHFRLGVKADEYISLTDVLRANPEVKLPMGKELVSLRDMRRIETKLQLKLFPKLPPRGAHIFVDADGITADSVRSICASMDIVHLQSTRVVARQPNSPSHTTQEVVCPAGAKTYMLVEEALNELRNGADVVLKDVLIICSDTKRELYTNHVAHAVSFPDAPVYVCTPTTAALVVPVSDADH